MVGSVVDSPVEGKRFPLVRELQADVRTVRG